MLLPEYHACTAHVLHVYCRDKPEDLGFPPVEPVDSKPAKDGKAEKPKSDIMGTLMNSVIKNPFIWGMALTYFFIYVVRQVRCGTFSRAELCTACLAPVEYLHRAVAWCSEQVGRFSWLSVLGTVCPLHGDARCLVCAMCVCGHAQCACAQGVTSWFVFYLIKEKGIEDAAQVGGAGGAWSGGCICVCPERGDACQRCERPRSSYAPNHPLQRTSLCCVCSFDAGSLSLLPLMMIT